MITLPPCDVAVVGAGPAGAATALRLARSGCRVTLLERSRFAAPRIGESLAPSVQPLLVELGLWSRFVASGPLPSYGTRSAWGAAHDERAPDADAHSHLQTPYLTGWHVDRQRFDRMLAESARDAGAALRLGARVVGCSPGADGGAVLCMVDAIGASSESELRADVVIDATGRGSSLARWLGARHAVFDRLVGVAARFDDPAAGTHCYTLVEATPDGWWYVAPVDANRTMAMFMTDGDLARVSGAETPPGWESAVRSASATRARLAEARRCWGPRIVSAVSQRLRRARVCPVRWLAVGDAALAVDPISGSGVVRALRTARAAAAAVLAVLSGDRTALPAYEVERDEECTAYLVERIGYYGIERRWPDAPFWRRRLAVADRYSAIGASTVGT